MNKKEIIVVSFSFPPIGGVGTRRWSKFAKYLAKDGYKVHVITIDYPHNDKNQNFLDEVQDENIVIHRLKFDYPYFILQKEKSFFMKVVSRLSSMFLNKYFYKLGIQEGWQKHFLPYVKNLVIENNIKDVVVTTPPGLVAYYSAFLKVDIPKINLILDFRDPWASMTHYSYGNNLKSFETKEKIVQMEKMAVELSDIVVNVSQGHTQNFKFKYKHCNKDKFKTIFNGYDSQDIGNFEKNSTKSFSLLYAGSFGLENRALAVKLLARAIKELDDEYINENLKVQLYTTANESYFFDGKCDDIIKKNFIFNKYVAKNEIMKVIAQSAYCLSINGPSDKDAMGTKVYEYFALKKKILHISNGGELSNILIESNENYVSNYDIEELKEQLLIMKSDFINNNLEIKNENFYSKFDIENLAKDYQQLFIGVR